MVPERAVFGFWSTIVSGAEKKDATAKLSQLPQNLKNGRPAMELHVGIETAPLPVALECSYTF